MDIRECRKAHERECENDSPVDEQDSDSPDDEEYLKNKPIPLPYEQIKDRIVILYAETVDAGPLVLLNYVQNNLIDKQKQNIKEDKTFQNTSTKLCESRSTLQSDFNNECEDGNKTAELNSNLQSNTQYQNKIIFDKLFENTVDLSQSFTADLESKYISIAKQVTEENSDINKTTDFKQSDEKNENNEPVKQEIISTNPFGDCSVSRITLNEQQIPTGNENFVQQRQQEEDNECFVRFLSCCCSCVVL